MNAVTRIEEHRGTPAVVNPNPMAMIEAAVMGGADVAVIEKLMMLQERWQANQGRAEFSRAMSAAKAEIGPILKTREVDFTTVKGRTNYQYEDLGQISKQIDPILSKHGLSYRFRTEVTDGTIIVTCIVEHRDGHSEQTSLPGKADDTGNKNSIQAVGSTVTYLQRYTLKAALGLAATKDDDASSPPAVDNTPITAEQLQSLRAALDLTETKEDDFLAFINKAAGLDVQKLEDWPARLFKGANDRLLDKKRLLDKRREEAEKRQKDAQANA